MKEVAFTVMQGQEVFGTVDDPAQALLALPQVLAAALVLGKQRFEPGFCPGKLFGVLPGNGFPGLFLGGGLPMLVRARTQL